MSNPRSSKRDIDRAKRERAAQKRQRRQGASDDAAPGLAQEGSATASTSARSEEAILEALRQLHARYEAEALSFDEFDAAKSELLDQLAQQ